MNFELSPEQEQLRDNVARLMKDRYGFEARKTFQASPHGWSEALWRDYAEMGLLGAPFAEVDGGFGGGAVETMIVMEQFGKALALEPYLQTVVLCGALLKHGASDKQRAELIGAIAAGELKLSFAHMEKQSGFDLHDVGLSAVKDGGARLIVQDSIEGLKLDEFFLLLSSTGCAYRRCELAWVNGHEIGANFVKRPAKSARSTAPLSTHP